MRSVRPEIDDPVLVVAEHPVQAALDQNGHVCKGAERAISDEYITWLEFVVCEGRLGDFVRAERGRQEFQE